MLKSAGSEGRGATAKVADFGLSARMDSTETHMSNCYQVGGALAAGPSAVGSATKLRSAGPGWKRRLRRWQSHAD
jgi:hypothetical protein